MAVPNKLGQSQNVGHITFDPGKGIILRSPDGQRWRVTVANTGALGTVLAE